MNTRSIIFSLLLVSLFSCEKDKCHIPHPNNLVIGVHDHCKLQYKVYNPPIIIKVGSDGKKVKRNFDLLKDGNPDFLLLSVGEEWGPNNRRSIIENINHSFEIIVDIISDSVFNCLGHLNEFNTTLPITYSALTGYQCSNPEDDSLEGVYLRSIPTQFNIMDTLHVEDHYDYDWYNSASFSLFMKGTGEVYGREKVSYYLWEYWNNQGPKYLIFRINYVDLKNNIDVNKYGWLKIEIIDYNEIWFYESAIQK